MFRKLLLASAVSLSLSPSIVDALGLGPIRSESALNQPFSGQIELVGVDPEELDTVKANIASEDEYTRAGLDRTFFATTLKFETAVDASGKPVLRVSSRDPVVEPFLDFLVEVNYPGGRAVKGYTVLVNPPTVRLRPQSRVPSSRGGGAAFSGPALVSYGPVRSGDSLWTIANSIAPRGATAQQTMMALYRNNQHAFIGRNINKLRRGAKLVIPTSSELYALDPQSARREFSAALAGRRVTTAPLTDISQPDRLALAAPAEIPSSPPPPVSQQPAAAAPSPDLDDIKRDVLLVQEAGESTRIETDELRGRIRELEGQLSDIRRLLDLSREQVARYQALVGEDGDTAPIESLPEEDLGAPDDVLDLPPEIVAESEFEGEDAGFEIDSGEDLAAGSGFEPAQDLPVGDALEIETDLGDAAEEPSQLAGVDESALGDEPLAGLPDFAPEDEPSAPSEDAMDEPASLVAAAGESGADDLGMMDAPPAGPDLSESSSDFGATGLAESPDEMMGEDAAIPGERLAQEAELGPDAALDYSPELPVLSSPEAEAEIVVDEEPVAMPAEAGAGGETDAMSAAAPTVESERIPQFSGDSSATQKGLMDSLPWQWIAAGGGGALALLLGTWAVLRRRKGLQEGLDEGQLLTATGEGSAVADTTATITSRVPKASPFSEFAHLDEETDEADIISEADVYIAYGRYREAESLLEDEIGRTPERIDLKFKLAEAYFGARNLDGLTQVREQIRLSGGEDANPEQWRKLGEMLRTLKDSKADEQHAAEESQIGGVDVRDDLGSVDSDFDLGSTSIGGSEAAPTGAPPSEVVGHSETVSEGLDDLDLDDLDLTAGLQTTTGASERPGSETEAREQQRLERAMEEFDASGIGPRELPPARPEPIEIESDLLGSTKSQQQPQGTSDISSLQMGPESSLWDEAATKVDLARAYLEMEDAEAARAILQEVLREGNAEQRAEAKEMLNRMG